jgi:hypothetical protein
LPRLPRCSPPLVNQSGLVACEEYAQPVAAVTQGDEICHRLGRIHPVLLSRTRLDQHHRIESLNASRGRLDPCILTGNAHLGDDEIFLGQPQKRSSVPIVNSHLDGNLREAPGYDPLDPDVETAVERPFRFKNTDLVGIEVGYNDPAVCVPHGRTHPNAFGIVDNRVNRLVDEIKKKRLRPGIYEKALRIVPLQILHNRAGDSVGGCVRGVQGQRNAPEVVAAIVEQLESRSLIVKVGDVHRPVSDGNTRRTGEAGVPG